MKVFIWIACFFTLSALIVILKNAGIVLGGIPTAILFGITLWSAKALTKRIDNKRKNKKQGKQKPEQYAMIEREEKSEEEKQKQTDANTVKGKKIKIGSFLSSHIKVVVILTAVCVLLMIVSIIGYNICDTSMTTAYWHYDETSYLDGIGCGLMSCPYCNGEQYEQYDYRGPYIFEYYSNASDAMTCFEVFCVVFAVLTFLCFIVLFVGIAFRYKFTIQITRKEHTDGN